MNRTVAGGDDNYERNLHPLLVIAWILEATTKGLKGLMTETAGGSRNFESKTC